MPDLLRCLRFDNLAVRVVCESRPCSRRCYRLDPAAPPRPVEGRCAQCRYLNICGGNTRVRAYQLTGNPWAEDPACYLSDSEIGLPENQRAERIPMPAHSGSAHRIHARTLD